VRISAKADYAIRAAAELAARGGADPVKADQIAAAQEIPLKFLLNILNELRRAGLVSSQRGPAGGYRLARQARETTLAEVIRAVEGPLASVHETRPEDVHYPGASAALRDVWIAVRASLRSVLEAVTVADLVEGSLSPHVRRLLAKPDALVSRWPRR
jgi:Rrf2 family protein